MPRKIRPKQPSVEPTLSETHYKTISPKNEEQAYCIKQIWRNDIIFIVGPAGCGKTAIASALAAEALHRGIVDKVILSRPCVGSEDLGYLPGDQKEKIDPYLQPLFTELSPYINVKHAIAQNKIQVVPISYMRGITFKDSFVVVDEVQNMNFRQIKLVLTRYGTNSKLILMGDVTQSDLHSNECKDFSRVVERMQRVAAIPENRVCIVELTQSVRHYLVKVMLDALGV